MHTSQLSGCAKLRQHVIRPTRPRAQARSLFAEADPVLWAAAHRNDPPQQRLPSETGSEVTRSERHRAWHDAAPQPGDTPARTHSVLIVDDSEESRDLLRWQLGRDSRLRVVGEATDGAQALSSAVKLQPELIILDLNMPHRDGLSILPQLYAAVPHTRVVVLTSYNSPDALHAALDLGAVQCLLKGTRRTDLLRALHRALGLND